jgi:mannose-6-phosphate isomerase
MSELTPFRLRPWFRTRIWGVRDLSPWYDYAVGEEPIGEVWLSGEDCTVDSGPWTDTPMGKLFAEHREDLLGAAVSHVERFPLLIKVLFPQEKLSVQVHPDDVLARLRGEPHGKTECWYALEAAPGATVALGFLPGVTEAQVRAAIEQKALESLLHWLPVAQGDMIFVDAGTVHAIGPGLVLLETQQNSDMTYRMYDYGRPRELHLEESFRAMRLQTQAGKVASRVQAESTVLIESQYFRVDRFTVQSGAAARTFAQERSQPAVQLLFAASGSGELLAEGCEPVTLRRGEMAIVPACTAVWQLRAAGSPSAALEILRAVPR